MPDTVSNCVRCHGEVHPHRAALGFNTCTICGEVIARERKDCVVPLHKSNYIVVTDRKDLVGINSKGGLVK